MMVDRLGLWSFENDMPRFEYTGVLPYDEKLENGKRVKLPDNPWFLLGNPQITIFAHVSGEMELLTGRRSWGRMNSGDVPTSYVNRAGILADGKEYSLTGTASVAADNRLTKRIFGCGFATFIYELDKATVRRTWSVAPAKGPKGGTAAALVTVEIINKSHEILSGSCREYIGVHYDELQYQGYGDRKPMKYEYTPFTNETRHYAGYDIKGIMEDPLLAGNSSDMSKVEGYPPYLAVRSYDENVRVTATDSGKTGSEGIEVCADYSLAGGETVQIQFVVGILHSREEREITSLSHNIVSCLNADNGKKQETHENLWKEYLPDFPDEEDAEIRRELIWHAYTLEAMANYSEFYDETKIPQGTCYDYLWGKHASARDNMQHALPLAYYNPAMCKSVIRYMLMRTTPYGEVRLVESGFGYAEHEGYFTSDQQLFLFLLVEEYLRITGDYALLDENVRPYPVRGMAELSIYDMLKCCFVFLRDTIGVGEHGIVRMYNSDWNDTIYYIERVPYNTVVLRGESHMNSAMAVSILERFVREIERYREFVKQADGGSAQMNIAMQIDSTEQTNGAMRIGSTEQANGAGRADGVLRASCVAHEDVSSLIQSIRLYKNRIYAAFMEDMGERSFPRRMYFNDRAYGEENMFLEPMGYTLWMEEFPVERKRIIYNEMVGRLYQNEVLGARQQQEPEFESPSYDKGSRENGGFWWALNGPVIMGLSTFDPNEAGKRLKQMMLCTLEQHFPRYWTSYWSAADNVESSLIPEEGLPDQSDNYADQPVYCAHPHAWILYCYYLLNEG